MRIVQISDPHLSAPSAQLYGGYAPDRAFTRVLERVAGLDPRPDFVWLTGDLVQNGRADEYANFRRLIRGFDLPAAAIPGNHDRRDVFAAGLAGGPVAIGQGRFLHLTIDGHPLRMIGLDTVAVGLVAGELCPARLDWLEARLREAPERPTLLFMHHPPFATGIRFSDASCCADGPALAAVLARHPCVIAVSCGHVHRDVRTTWAGRPGGICPSVAWAVPLDLSPHGKPRLEPQNPGFQLHLWDADSRSGNPHRVPGT